MSLNRWVFKWRLKVRMFSHSRMSAGREFQVDGAATEKARLAMQFGVYARNDEHRSIGRSLNYHISVKNHPILIKFGTLQQILNPMTVMRPKIEF